jgi:HrpA-like RNA helicase
MDASVLDPHTQADNDASRSTVEDHRKSLPIYAFRETLLDAIKEVRMIG